MKQKKNCCNCMHGTLITVNKDILCKDKGAVSPDYVCSKHRFSPVIKPFRDLRDKCINCENFIVNQNNLKDNTTVGLCQLFSVRHFDGKEKKACSKFIRRIQSEVS